MLFSQKFLYMRICLSYSAVLWACFVLAFILLPLFASVTLHHTEDMCLAYFFFSVFSFTFLSLFIHYCFFLCLKLLHISSQLSCLHNRSHFSISYSVTSQPIYVPVLSHFCFSPSPFPYLQTVSWGRCLRRACCLVCRQRAPTQRQNQRWVTIYFFQWSTCIFFFFSFSFWCLFSLLVKLSGLSGLKSALCSCGFALK